MHILDWDRGREHSCIQLYLKILSVTQMHQSDIIMTNINKLLKHRYSPTLNGNSKVQLPKSNTLLGIVEILEVVEEPRKRMCLVSN